MAASDTLFVRACRGEPVSRVPVWLMRQAGRYMPEYQAVRAEAGGFHELCTHPELAARATLDAARILDTDAAIIFSDITLPGEAMGVPLAFAPGPRFEDPVRTPERVRALRPVKVERDLGHVYDAIRITRRELPLHKSLIGFVGAPLTLAAYMIEGEPGKNWLWLKRLAYGSPKTLHALLEQVTDVVAEHAAAQARAGCDALQLFDTTAGVLAERELHDFAFAYAARVFERLRPLNVPLIYFARDIGAHLEAAAGLGADVLGVDWTVSLTEARRRVTDRVALMGNLDPGVLFTSREEVRERARRLLEEMRGRRGYVFNLGHGVLPETPVENVVELVRTVKLFSA